MISIHLMDCATKKLLPAPPEILQQDKDAVAPVGRVLWIDLADPTPEEEALVLERFLPVHPLTLEDVTRLRRAPNSPPHFPKVEEFPGYLFVVVNPLTRHFLGTFAAPDREPEHEPACLFTQLSAVLTHTILITHHYEPLGCIDYVHGFMARRSGQAARGPDFLFHLALDSTVDEYAPVLDHVDESLDQMELAVIEKPRPPLFQRLLRLKRQIVLLRKTLIYEREVLVRLARGEFELVDERETVYYRNVYDHLVRFAELIDSSRDMASDLMQTYLASTSNHLNQIMKLLTMISTVVLPMTLVAGVYGMNFDHMPELEWVYGYPFALGLMTLMGVGSLTLFWWRRWL